MSYQSSTKVLGKKRKLSKREISPEENKKIFVEDEEKNCIVKLNDEIYINSSENKIKIIEIIFHCRNAMIYKGKDQTGKRYGIKITQFEVNSTDSRTIDIIDKLDSSKKLHFVNYYSYFTCNRVSEIISDKSDNEIISSTKHMAFKDKHIISIMDLYNYNNKSIIKNMYDDTFNHYHKKNIFSQIIISILSFHIFTKRLHLDVQLGNFFIEILSKSGKITQPIQQNQTRHSHKYRQSQQSMKPIEYISYIIYGNLIHLENIDLNVIIGDYEFSIDYNDDINAVKNYREDYHAIINMGIENNFFYILNEERTEEIKNVNSFKNTEEDYIKLLMENTDIFADKHRATDENSTAPFFIS